MKHIELADILGGDVTGENAEHCVSCGEIIPEGRQVCPACEGGV